jgi:uncharacterized protein YndB with AHSA1/START domain
MSRVALCLLAAALSARSDELTQLSKPSDREIAITRSFAAPIRKVFDALTRQDQLPRWFQAARMSLASYQADVRPGGTSRFVFQRLSGKTIEMRHTYREVDAPRRWVHVESYDFSPLQLTVTTILTENGGTTAFRQTIRYASQKERDADFDNVAGSAAELYARLDRYLASSR